MWTKMERAAINISLKSVSCLGYTLESLKNFLNPLPKSSAQPSEVRMFRRERVSVCVHSSPDDPVATAERHVSCFLKMGGVWMGIEAISINPRVQAQPCFLSKSL